MSQLAHGPPWCTLLLFQDKQRFCRLFQIFRPPTNVRNDDEKNLVLVLLIFWPSVSIAAADTIYLRGVRRCEQRARLQLMAVCNPVDQQRPPYPCIPETIGNQSEFPSNTKGTTRTVAPANNFPASARYRSHRDDGRSWTMLVIKRKQLTSLWNQNWIDTGVDLRRGERVRVVPTDNLMRAVCESLRLDLHDRSNAPLRERRKVSSSASSETIMIRRS